MFDMVVVCTLTMLYHLVSIVMLPIPIASNGAAALSAACRRQSHRNGPVLQRCSKVICNTTSLDACALVEALTHYREVLSLTLEPLPQVKILPEDICNTSAEFNSVSSRLAAEKRGGGYKFVALPSWLLNYHN